MNATCFKLLLLEDNPADADLLQEILAETTSIHYQITWVELLSEAIGKLQQDDFDVVLSDLSLPDAYGLDTVIQIHALVPDMPIVVLTGLEDETQGLEAIRQGAQEYLIKGQIDYNLLMRTIRYAIERASTQKVMRQQSAAMAACTEGIAILNQSQEYTYLNQAHIQIYGYNDPAELIGQTWRIFYDEAEQARLEQTVLSAVQQQGHGIGEAIGRRRDGSYFEQELSMTALAEGGYVCTVRDISDRKQAEEELRRSEAHFRQIFEAAPIGMCLADVQTRQILEVNSGWCDIVGYTAEESTTLNFDTISYPDDLVQDIDYLQQAAQGELTSYRMEKRYIRKDTALIWTNLAVTVLHDRNGKPRFSLGMVEDITTRKQAEAEIWKALEKERELNQLKSNFVSMVSHEFRTPMTTIRTASELLQCYSQQLSDEKKTKYFGQIQSSIQHMLHLLDEVLILGRTEAGGLQFNPAPLDLATFCHELVEVSHLSANSEHTISLTCQGSCQAAVMDEILLRHIFTNLLSNAVKYSPQGGTIQFSLNCQDDLVTFQVQDAGIGIPEKDQQRLFETFHRASNVGRIQGTGLGLAIVKSCVELHRGKIQVQSRMGVGTTFTVLLPLRSLAT